MLKLKNLNLPVEILRMLVLIMIVLCVSGAKTLAQTTSASNSPNSATAVDDADLRRACAEAVEELKAARKLITAQGVQIERQAELIKLEQLLNVKLSDLRMMDADEKQELRNAIAAKDVQIAAIEAAVAALKKEKPSPWTKFKWVGGGIAVGIIAGAFLQK